jgi:hypothetical protein
MSIKIDFDRILRTFGLDPDATQIKELQLGHINDSYILNVQNRCRFFLQRINHHVFTDPESLMQNLHQVNEAMDVFYSGHDKNPYPAAHQSRDKKYFFKDHDGSYWRLMDFVPGSRSFNIAFDAGIAREGAAAFGRFQRAMINEDPDYYTPTIPDFHHLGKRLERLQQAIGNDALKRSEMASSEIAFATARMGWGDKLEQLLQKKIIPLRVTHNDTKLNNVLFKENSIEAICVVDLDTVMPGSVLFDYGDMVRTFTSAAEEDEPDVSKVIFRETIFEALTEGYLSELRGSLAERETSNLLFGAKIMLLMIGARFLTDFLEGDHYFKTSREGHNLERARNQFVLLKQLEDKEEILHKIIRKYA